MEMSIEFVGMNKKMLDFVNFLLRNGNKPNSKKKGNNAVKTHSDRRSFIPGGLLYGIVILHCTKSKKKS